MEDILLDINDLVITFTTDGKIVQAVNGVKLSIKKGETVGLVGETGAGKTTIAKGILRLIPNPPGEIKGGTVLFKGDNLIKKTPSQMQKIRGNQISMIFQDPMTALNPVLTVGEQISEVIRLHQKLSRVDAKIKAGEMLKLVGIPQERLDEYPHQFSGGMKQRVVIAIALACNPQLLIADEPTTALDVTIQAQILELMIKLKVELNTAMLLITHDLGVVSEICDRVAIIYAGDIIEFGTTKEIFKNTKHPYTMGLFNSIPSIDGEKLERLNYIPGLMPDPTNLPSGCHFHPRCEYKLDICDKVSPEVFSLSDGHYVKCHYVEKNMER